MHQQKTLEPGCTGQSVTCLTEVTCLTADPGVASSIPARSHTLVEIDHEIFSTVSYKKSMCTKYWFKLLSQDCLGKKCG